VSLQDGAPHGARPDTAPDTTPGAVAQRATTRVRVSAATLVLATLAVLGQPLIARQYRFLLYDSTSLYSRTVGLGPDGRPVPVTSHGTDFVAGTRVLDPGPKASAAQREAAAALAAEHRGWLSSGVLPGRGTRWAPMVADALADIRTLTQEDGAVVAGWTEHWRYVWPRDSAFVVAALGCTGHARDGLALLRFLQSQQHVDGRFEARYRPDGSGPPDGRGIQLDGAGWTLWATARLADDLERAEGRQAALVAIGDLRALIDRSTAAALEATRTPSGLPPASPDYWEVREDHPTLGTSAPLAAGLAAAARLYTRLGDYSRAAPARDASVRLYAAIAGSYGEHGYSRDPDGGARDTAVAFLLPPFRDQVDGAVLAAWQRAQRELRRPAGGLAPGAGWKADGVSWTPETAVFALTAAAVGDRERAEGWLDWLDAHRTDEGSLSEKVLHDGTPAGVAPLTWTAATVILAVDALDRREPPPSP
jgi:glucoamylase